MKYMMIEVMEREISEPEYFDTHDAAHDEMCRRVAEVYDISPDEVKESYLEGEDPVSYTHLDVYKRQVYIDTK